MKKQSFIPSELITFSWIFFSTFLLSGFLLFAGYSFAASTDDIFLTEDTFSATQNNESTDTIISESILLPIQQVGTTDTIVERAHELSTCGNSQIEFSEVCDKNNFAGKTCATYGKNSGNLSCSSTCKTIITSACVNVTSPTPTPIITATPVVTSIITPTPTSPIIISPTPLPSSGGGGGYNPIIWTTPSHTIGTISSYSPTPVIENAGGEGNAGNAQNSLSSTPVASSGIFASLIEPWLNNGSDLGSNVEISPWLHNSANLSENNNEKMTATGILSFEEWRYKHEIDALPSSEEDKKIVTKAYISYVQNELEQKKNTDPVSLASMIDGSVNPERQFGESDFGKNTALTNPEEVFHSAALEKMPFWNEYGVCYYPLLWFFIIFLLGMVIEYILYSIFFSRKYEQ